MKKNYKKVQVLAKNAPTGSYAAGCPTGQKLVGSTQVKTASGQLISANCGGCEACEIAK